MAKALTTTVDTEKVYAHPDGGTYTIVADAPTERGRSVRITKWTTYRGETVYQVWVVNAYDFEDKSRMMIRAGWRKTEKGARLHANATWMREMHPVQMIYR